nr:serine hydrolase [Actinoplanes palleronii]
MGFPVAESDLFLRTEELARFARLLLQGGEWAGRPVIPADYVRRMPLETVPTADSPGGQFTHGYGLGVWLGGNGTYRMDGLYGQYAVIAPDLRAAVTVTAHSDHDEDLLTAVYEVLDRLRG